MVQFKLEAGRKLIYERAYSSLRANGSDYVVANMLRDLKLGYRAVLIDKDKAVIKIASKRDLFRTLHKLLT